MSHSHRSVSHKYGHRVKSRPGEASPDGRGSRVRPYSSDRLEYVRGHLQTALCFGVALISRHSRRRQLEHRRGLAWNKPRYHHDLATGKFERVVMNVRVVRVDLTEAGNPLIDAGPAEHRESAVISDIVVERDFGAGEQADRDFGLADFGKSAGDRLRKIGRDELIGHLRRPRGDRMQAVITNGE